MPYIILVQLWGTQYVLCPPKSVIVPRWDYSLLHTIDQKFLPILMISHTYKYRSQACQHHNVLYTSPHPETIKSHPIFFHSCFILYNFWSNWIILYNFVLFMLNFVLFLLHWFMHHFHLHFPFLVSFCWRIPPKLGRLIFLSCIIFALCCTIFTLYYISLMLHFH